MAQTQSYLTQTLAQTQARLDQSERDLAELQQQQQHQQNAQNAQDDKIDPSL